MTKISGSEDFLRIAKIQVLQMIKDGLDPTDNVQISMDDVYVVLYAYVLGNQKATISTTLPDGKYYEVTYNSEKDEMYVDCYVKLKQNVIKNICV
jgi:hypothetical protein